MKKDIIKLQKDAEKIKKIAEDMTLELEELDNEILIKRASRIVNAKI